MPICPKGTVRTVALGRAAPSARAEAGGTMRSCDGMKARLGQATRAGSIAVPATRQRPRGRRVLAVPADQAFARDSTGQRHTVVEPVLKDDKTLCFIGIGIEHGETPKLAPDQGGIETCEQGLDKIERRFAVSGNEHFKGWAHHRQQGARAFAVGMKIPRRGEQRQRRDQIGPQAPPAPPPACRPCNSRRDAGLARCAL